MSCCIPLTCIPSCCLGEENNYKKGLMYLEKIPQDYNYLGEKYGKPYAHTKEYYKAFKCFVAVIKETERGVFAFKRGEAHFELGKIVLGCGTIGADNCMAMFEALTGEPFQSLGARRGDSSADIALKYLDRAARVGHVRARNLIKQYRQSNEFKEEQEQRERQRQRSSHSYQNSSKSDPNELMRQLLRSMNRS